MSVADVLTYTPLVQLLVLYVYFYQHDLGRVFHGRVQRDDRLAWWEAFSEIGLLGDIGAKKPSGIFVPLKFLALLAVSALASLLLMPLVPYLVLAIPVLSRFQALVLPLAQFIPAGIFLVGLGGLWLGPTPVGPHRHILPSGRTGSMVRHLESQETNG